MSPWKMFENIAKKLHFQDVFKKMVFIRFLIIITKIYCSGEGPFGFWGSVHECKLHNGKLGTA